MKNTFFKFVLLTTIFFLTGCVSNTSIHHHYYGYQGKGNPPPDAMPREGWATDPHLSYALFSYYPYDFYHGGFYQAYYHY